jgi:hypothetical protein
VAVEVVGVTAAATAAAVRRGHPNDPLQNQQPHPQKQLQQGHPIEESGKEKKKIFVFFLIFFIFLKYLVFLITFL